MEKFEGKSKAEKFTEKEKIPGKPIEILPEEGTKAIFRFLKDYHAEALKRIEAYERGEQELDILWMDYDLLESREKALESFKKGEFSNPDLVKALDKFTHPWKLEQEGTKLAHPIRSPEEEELEIQRRASMPSFGGVEEVKKDPMGYIKRMSEQGERHNAIVRKLEVFEKKREDWVGQIQKIKEIVAPDEERQKIWFQQIQKTESEEGRPMKREEIGKELKEKEAELRKQLSILIEKIGAEKRPKEREAIEKEYVEKNAELRKQIAFRKIAVAEHQKGEIKSHLQKLEEVLKKMPRAEGLQQGVQKIKEKYGLETSKKAKEEVEEPGLEGVLPTKKQPEKVFEKPFEKLAEKPPEEISQAAEKKEKFEREAEFAKQIDGLKPGDIVVSRSGTQRKITKIEGDQIYFEKTDAEGNVTEDSYPREKFKTSIYAIKEIKKEVGEKISKPPLEKAETAGAGVGKLPEIPPGKPPEKPPVKPPEAPPETPKGPEKGPESFLFPDVKAYRQELDEASLGTAEWLKFKLGAEGSKQIEDRMRQNPKRQYETKSRWGITIEILDEQYRKLFDQSRWNATNINKRKSLAEHLITAQSELGMFSKSENIFQELTKEEGALGFLGKDFIKQFQGKNYDLVAKLFIEEYRNGKIKSNDALNVLNEYPAMGAYSDRFGKELEKIKQEGRGMDVSAKKIDEIISKNQEDWVAKLKEIGLTDKEIIGKIEEHWDGSTEHAEELKTMEMAIAAMEESPEKETAVQLFIGVSRAINNYREAFLASEFINDKNLKEKIQLNIKEGRIDYQKNYFKEQLKLQDSQIGGIKPLLKDYSPVRVYPTTEKIDIKQAYDEVSKFINKKLSEKTVTAEKMEIPIEAGQEAEMREIVEKGHDATFAQQEEIQKNVEEIMETIPPSRLRKVLGFGGKSLGFAAGGLLLALLFYCAAPLIGMYAGMKEGLKELTMGLAKEAGIDLKKKRGGEEKKKKAA